MTDLRIALISPDGTCEVGGVKHVLVKKEIVETLLKADDSYPVILATPDLSSLPRVPARHITTGEFEHGRVVDWAKGYNAALDAMGIK